MTTFSDGEVRRLTAYQRNLLIDHIDGAVEVTVRDPHMVGVRNSLMKVGLLRGEKAHTKRPRGTVLTERGRMAVSLVLGEYADALVRAGLLEQDNPLQVLKELKARSLLAKPVHIGSGAATAGIAKFQKP